MALDGIFLHHLKNEISDFAVDSRVDKIHQPSRVSLLLLCVQGRAAEGC